MRDKDDKQNATARRNSSELLARSKKFAIEESGLGHKAAIPALKSEAAELIAIFVTIAKSAKSKLALGRR